MDQQHFIDRDDPTHSTSPAGVAWSRVNEKGTHPGVCTPLNWSIWGELGERAVRRGNYELGVLPRAECAPATRVEDRVWSIFHGRVASNVDTWRWLSTRTPGRSGEGSEATNFGNARRSTAADSARPSYLAAAWRLPYSAFTLPARMRALRARSHVFWCESLAVAAEAEPARVLARLRRAVVTFESADVVHIVAAMLAGVINDSVGALAQQAGQPELQGELLAGLPNLEEHETSVDLWRVARGEISLEHFLAQHGFHGPAEGEISRRSWREDPAPLHGLIATLRGLPDDRDPRRGEVERAGRGARAREALLRALPRSRQPWARLVLAAMGHLFPYREVGKASLILHLDAARACVRRCGAELAKAGRLDAADDVFFLLLDEIDLRGPDLRSLAKRRHERHREFEALDLPDAWTGMPETRARSAAVDERVFEDTAPVSGLGIGGGSVEGRVVVVDDPSRFASDFGEGDILVADSTDPSWAPFFMVAAGVVMDAGSAISHAAIVAREMGIPAVVATGNATARLRSGWRVRVDGDAGLVHILERR
jgi:pyruvate,water dikinase